MSRLWIMPQKNLKRPKVFRWWCSGQVTKLPQVLSQWRFGLRFCCSTFYFLCVVLRMARIRFGNSSIRRKGCHVPLYYVVRWSYIFLRFRFWSCGIQPHFDIFAVNSACRWLTQWLISCWGKKLANLLEIFGKLHSLYRGHLACPDTLALTLKRSACFTVTRLYHGSLDGKITQKSCLCGNSARLWICCRGRCGVQEKPCKVQSGRLLSWHHLLLSHIKTTDGHVWTECSLLSKPVIGLSSSLFCQDGLKYFLCLKPVMELRTLLTVIRMPWPQRKIINHWSTKCITFLIFGRAPCHCVQKPATFIYSHPTPPSSLSSDNNKRIQFATTSLAMQVIHY